MSKFVVLGKVLFLWPMLLFSRADAFDIGNPGCDEEVILGANPGDMVNVTIPVSSPCRMATAFYSDSDPAPIAIESSCQHQNASSQSFEVQIGKDTPFGIAHIVFLCGDGNDTFCVPFNIEPPISSGGSKNDSIRSHCYQSSTEASPPSSTSETLSRVVLSTLESSLTSQVRLSQALSTVSMTSKTGGTSTAAMVTSDVGVGVTQSSILAAPTEGVCTCPP